MIICLLTIKVDFLPQSNIIIQIQNIQKPESLKIPQIYVIRILLKNDFENAILL